MRFFERAAIAFIAVSLVLVVASGPMAAAISTGNLGSKVTTSTTDFNPQYAATPATPTICSRDTGVAADVTDDLYYLNIDGAGTVVAAFDLRLTTAESRQAGTFVGTSDSDLGQTFNGLACTAFA